MAPALPSKAGAQQGAHAPAQQEGTLQAEQLLLCLEQLCG